MPLVTVLRPCGNGTSPLDHTTVGGGKPSARQEREATEFPVTFVTLSGISMNWGAAGKTNKQVINNHITKCLLEGCGPWILLNNQNLGHFTIKRRDF